MNPSQRKKDEDTANTQFHVGDGQTFPDGAVVAIGTEIAPVGAVFNGDSVPNANPNGPQMQWDIKDFNITPLLGPCPNTLHITSAPYSDSLSCVLIAIDLPVGAAPEQPGTSVPEPGSLALAGLALAGLGVSRRKGKKPLGSN